MNVVQQQKKKEEEEARKEIKPDVKGAEQQLRERRQTMRANRASAAHILWIV